MGIPDDILLKADKLTDQEWEIMRKHPVYSHDLLSSIEFLEKAIEIPYTHHEKWDGSGYPRGLKGEEIPLTGRIFAVVDCWDALRSDRPYRKAISDLETWEYIRQNSGIAYDPAIVEKFAQLMGFSL
jgi:HD-GYP domain-containing protein (c-di-GMP phosphodiesterase class II)